MVKPGNIIKPQRGEAYALVLSNDPVLKIRLFSDKKGFFTNLVPMNTTHSFWARYQAAFWEVVA